MPGPDGYKIPRYKSYGHHGGGFVDRVEAMAHINDQIKPAMAENIFHFGLPHIRCEADIEWDGKDIPALVEFFDGCSEPPVNDLMDSVTGG